MRGDGIECCRGEMVSDAVLETHGCRLDTGQGHTHKGEGRQDVYQLSSVHPLCSVELAVHSDTRVKGVVYGS